MEGQIIYTATKNIFVPNYKLYILIAEDGML